MASHSRVIYAVMMPMAVASPQEEIRAQDIGTAVETAGTGTRRAAIR